MIKKTSPSFNMMMEIYNFIKLLESIYMYGNDDNHFLFSATVPKGYDAAMIYVEGNFEIKFVLRRTLDIDEINIQTRRTTRSNNNITKNISFVEGDDVINNKEDEQWFLFIIACLMTGVAALATSYYKTKQL